MSDRYFHLLERHQKLDAALRLALLRRVPNPLEVVRLKKLKLMVKDRLAWALRRRAVSAGGSPR